MNKNRIIAFLVFLFIALVGYCDIPPRKNCNKGDQKPIDSIPLTPEDRPSDSLDIPVQVPMDPNEIIGTKGYDALGDTLQWVAATASLPYTIYFENDPELATAAAQKVEIRHALHPKADISTFAVGAFGFGSHVFTVEGNRSTYQQRLDLTSDMGIYVDVVAGIDIVSNEAFWIFQSIDPATGLPPQGTQQGFLPVNDENHSGEGYVSFTIKPKANACATGDMVTASASIIFDINEAIPTNVWYNTVDALPPTTQLTGQEGSGNEVLLQFFGTDDQGGCGIKQYKLYVSDNYSAYSLYDTYPVGSEAIFPTEYDHCYRFFCLGEDNVGNVEEMKNQAEYEYGNYNLMVSVSASPEEGGTVSGGGWYVYETQVTVSAMAAWGYDFYRWTHNGVPVSEESTYTFTITEEMDLVAQFVEKAPVVQQYELVQGWNWWSTYIEQNGLDGLSMLENSLGENGVFIHSQANGFTNYYDDYGWYGSLTSINNESSYMINTSVPCEVSMVGMCAQPTQHPITLNANGWTWIGYPVNVSLALDEALTNLTAIEGDMVKAQEGYAEYYEDYGWYGTLETLLPGMGLMFKSTSSQPSTFTYPDGSRSNAANTNLTSKNNHWIPELSAYSSNMTVTAVVDLDEEEIRSGHYELAAFANGECRGSVALKYVEPIDRYVAFLTIAGEDAVSLTFMLYDMETGMECINAAESLDYESNAIVGRLTKPFVIHFNGTTGIDEWSRLMQVYPNPASRGECFSIGMPTNVKIPVHVEIINALGSVVFEETFHQLPVSVKAPNATGVYTLRIIVEGQGAYCRKLVVE